MNFLGNVEPWDTIVKFEHPFIDNFLGNVEPWWDTTLFWDTNSCLINTKWGIDLLSPLHFCINRSIYLCKNGNGRFYVETKMTIIYVMSGCVDQSNFVLRLKTLHVEITLIKVMEDGNIQISSKTLMPLSQCLRNLTFYKCLNV